MTQTGIGITVNKLKKKIQKEAPRSEIALKIEALLEKWKDAVKETESSDPISHPVRNIMMVSKIEGKTSQFS